MDFNAIVDHLDFYFSIEWGDTVRIRDIYSPYIDLDIHLPQPDCNWLPNLRQIRLFSFDMQFPDVWDQFDEKEFWRNAKFGTLTSGSTLHISGPVHRRLISNVSPLFGSYDFILTDPHLHGIQFDVNGSLVSDVTEWLIEKDALSDDTEVSRASRLVVAWECAHVVDPLVPHAEKDLDV